MVSATYRGAAPAALDAVAAALHAGPRFVAGAVRRTRGTPFVDPTALVVGTTVVAPDLTPGDGGGALAGAATAPTDAVTAALDGALSVFAEAAHRGLRHLPSDFEGRCAKSAASLREIGLSKAAVVVNRFAAALSQPEAAASSWIDAQIRLVTTADAR
jgi:hypothetical protein